MLFSSCLKSKIDSKNNAPGGVSTLPRSVTCCGVNMNTASSTKIWGVNGHPDNQSAYLGNIDLQLNLMQEIGMNYYRVDMGTGNGELVGTNLTRFNELMTKCQQKGITVLPVLINHDWYASNYTRDDAYYVGHQLGYGFASRYGSNFHTYELGNEEEGYSLKFTWGADSSKNYWAGEVTTDYEPALIDKTIYYLNGMIEGIRAVDPTAKFVINAGWRHTGFLLWLQNRNVAYDIIGWHWYFTDIPVFQTVLHNLEGFHKDIWFTEFNRWLGSQGADGLNQQSDYVYDYLNELELHPSVKAIFPYELLDQDEAPSTENTYGLVSWNTRYTAYTKKPVVANWKYEIEENLHGNEDYVYSFFLYMNNRVPDPGGLQFWTNRLTTTQNRQELISVGTSQEANGRFVEEMYNSLLDDATISNDTWNYWLARMQNGAAREQVISELCGTDEFYTKSGSTTDGYVGRLYSRLLGRAATPGERSSWSAMINGTASSRIQVANSIIHLQEYYSRFVDAQFHKLLRRTGPVEQSSIDYYTGRLMNGWIQADLINTLLMSDEYWYRGINEGYLRRHPGFPLN